MYCYLIVTAGDHWGKAESIQLCDLIPSGLSHYRHCSAILVTTAMTQPPPLLSPILPPTSAPSLFNEGLARGYHHGKIVELKMFVGTF